MNQEQESACDMKENEIMRTTTFQMHKTLHSNLKMMCVLTDTSMGEFIRIAIRDKINQLSQKGVK